MGVIKKSLTLFGILVCAAACSGNSNDLGQNPPVFDVNFVVMSSRNGVYGKTSVQQLQNEVELLNKYFVGANGVHPVRFSYKGQHSIRALNGSSCAEFLRLGDAAVEFDWQRWTHLFNSCSDQRVVDPNAINIYIYDAYSNRKGFNDIDSRGKNNRNRPFVVLDWERLNHHIQSPEEHEMGHAFGLSHVCAEGAMRRSSTNIMASHDCGKGSGGRRNIGFDERQLKIVQQKARLIAAQLNNE